MTYLFIDFYFQNGELVSAPDGFNFWNLFNVVVGSLLGFGGAFIIFHRTTLASRRRDEEIRQQSWLDKSHYFKFLLKKVPAIIKTQSTYYEEFAQQVEQELTKIHIPKLTLHTPLPRLLELNQNEFFFHAYINQYSPEARERAIVEFGKLYSKLDYYDYVLKQSFESLKILRTRKREAMEVFRNRLKDVEDYAGSLLLDQQLAQIHGAYLHTLNNLFQQYIPAKQQNYSNFSFFMASFLDPILKFTMAIGQYPPQIHSLLILIKEARVAFSHIEYHSRDEADEFKQFAKEMSEGIEDFEALVQKVK